MTFHSSVIVEIRNRKLKIIGIKGVVFYDKTRFCLVIFYSKENQVMSHALLLGLGDRWQ